MTIRFKGKDQYDLDQQVWNWRSANPQLKVTKIHPTEQLPLQAYNPYPVRKIAARDTVSVLVEYNEA
jgi:hypothetical protein